jgi:hypothetical protein
MRPAGKPAVPIVNTAHKLTAVLAALIHLFLMLRPSLLRVSDRVSSPAAARAYAACADMSVCLGRMRATRKKALNRLENLLSDSLTVLRADGKDWLDGRAGDGSIAAWAENLETGVPAALDPVLRDWQAETDRYRSLYTAYTYERELLFRMDVSEDGFFAADWQGILNGTLSEERWDSLLAAPEITAPYRELLESLRRVSKGTGALLSRMESRGAERRMAREIANRADLQLHALRERCLMQIGGCVLRETVTNRKNFHYSSSPADAAPISGMVMATMGRKYRK